MVRRGRRFESVRGLFSEDEAAANSGFFVAATDTVEHLLVKEGVDGRPASGKNQNACKHTGAGTELLSARSGDRFWGQTLSRRVPMTCLLIRRVSLPPPAMKISSVLERGSS
jgi:hypothetical protein